MIFRWSLSVLDTFGHVAKEKQYIRIFKFFRNFDKVLIHLRILKIKRLKCSSKLITLMSQIASISHLSKIFCLQSAL